MCLMCLYFATHTCKYPKGYEVLIRLDDAEEEHSKLEDSVNCFPKPQSGDWAPFQIYAVEQREANSDIIRLRAPLASCEGAHDHW
jgi:hypothetical protein